MNPITAPITRTTTTITTITNLQDGLLLLLRRQTLRIETSERTRLETNITTEQANQTYGDFTARFITLFQGESNLTITGEIDPPTATALNEALRALGAFDPPTQFTVQGQLLQTDRTPISNTIVRAFDKDLRTEQLLGETTTGRDGSYTISYTTTQFRRTEKQNADLLIRAFNADGSTIATSPIRFNAQAAETIDLIAIGANAPEPSEYEKLLTTINPVLENTPLHELTTEEINFIVGQTGANSDNVKSIAQATKLSQATSLPADYFYGFLRGKLPSELPNLLKQSPDTLRRALETSLKNNIIPANRGTSIDSILNRLSFLQTNALLADRDESGKPTIGNLLNTAISAPSREIQQIFATTYLQHQNINLSVAYS